MKRIPRSSGASSPCLIAEPSVEDTIAILRGLKERYEVHHGVRIKDAAILAAATLSQRYITDRFLPDKAIDLIDEAAASLRMQIDSLPDRNRRNRTAHHAAGNRAAGAAQGIRRALAGAAEADSKKSWATLREQSDALKAQWQTEKDAIGRIRKLKEQIEQLKAEEQRFERAGDLSRVAEIRYGKLSAAEKELSRAGKARGSCKKTIRC